MTREEKVHEKFQRKQDRHNDCSNPNILNDEERQYVPPKN